MNVYLDYAATTPVDPRVVEAMLPYFTARAGNASSLHAFGQEARAAVDEARAQVAAAIGAHPSEIVFTSGATESDNLAVAGVALATESHGRHIVTTAIEHHAILEACHALQQRGYDVAYVPVDGRGIVDPDYTVQTPDPLGHRVNHLRPLILKTPQALSVGQAFVSDNGIRISVTSSIPGGFNGCLG